MLGLNFWKSESAIPFAAAMEVQVSPSVIIANSSQFDTIPAMNGLGVETVAGRVVVVGALDVVCETMT